MHVKSETTITVKLSMRQATHLERLCKARHALLLDCKPEMEGLDMEVIKVLAELGDRLGPVVAA